MAPDSWSPTPSSSCAIPLDLRRYVLILEAAVIGTAAAFGVEAAHLDGLPGIWVDGERKLAAIGVRVKRGVTTHGLALNVNTDLRWFDEMIPCGIPDKEVTTLARETGTAVPMERVEDELARQLAAQLGLRITEDVPGRHRSGRRTGAVTPDETVVERSARPRIPDTPFASRRHPSARGRRTPTSSGTGGPLMLSCSTPAWARPLR